MSIPTTTLETASLHAEAKDAVATAYDLGHELAQLGDFVRHALEPMYQISDFEDLEAKAVRLSSLAAQCHTFGGQLARLSGELKALGAVRRATVRTKPE